MIRDDVYLEEFLSEEKEESIKYYWDKIVSDPELRMYIFSYGEENGLPQENIDHPEELIFGDFILMLDIIEFNLNRIGNVKKYKKLLKYLNFIRKIIKNGKNFTVHNPNSYHAAYVTYTPSDFLGEYYDNEDLIEYLDE